jgi:5-methylcytosine-specific restriction endonuclease McrA
MMAVPKPKPTVIARRERRAAEAASARQVRAAVWRRDACRCRACNGRQQLQVHHLMRRSRGGRWTTDNCVLLCRACHQDVHARILTTTGADADRADGVRFERRRWW